MAKKIRTEKKLISLASLVAWLVGVLVSLSVGSGMASSVLTIPFLDFWNYGVTIVAGWIVIIGTILSVVMALFGK